MKFKPTMDAAGETIRLMQNLCESESTLAQIEKIADLITECFEREGKVLICGNGGRRGIFHLAGTGEATWAGFAEAIFGNLAGKGKGRPRLIRITSAEYPTPARRPANSRLDCAKIASIHGVKLPPWRDSLAACLERFAFEIPNVRTS